MEVVSLGSSTQTRVDSAAKHIRQCKIHERLMLVWLGSTQGSQGHETMHRQKNKYATMKDDLVLNVNESLNIGYAPADAYPSVLSNFTLLNPSTKELIAKWYAKSTPPAFFSFQQEIAEKKAEGMKENPQATTLPFFRAQGYALGRAEASMRSGDTVFSVLIGGQMTVRNGHFPMRPGQMVQWYFDFEDKMFDDDGRRRDVPENKNRELNQHGKRMHEQTSAESTSYALPKPYVLAKNGSEHYGDKIRIFAKCIAGGAAHHKVDIMLMTQSL
jgi:hypothetical protein